MTTSILTKNQKKEFSKHFVKGNKHYLLIAEVRYGDECNNGCNTFAITGTVYNATKEGKRNRAYKDCETCGCIHDIIAEHLPELAPAIKFQLCDSNSPMYYIENTLYHVKHYSFDYARSTAIWPEATDEELKSPDLKDRLEKRLPAIMEEFKKTVESFGFTY